MKLRLPKKRRYRISLYILSTLLVALAIDLIWVRIWRHITVNPATTRITSPLKPDGTPNYIKYVDDSLREGVTPENNAVIPFLEMVPQKEAWYVGDKLPELYQHLGLAEPPAGLPLVSFDDLLRKKTPPENDSSVERDNEETFVRKNPWSRAQHPDVVAYLEANEAALAVVPRVVARPRWYVPLLRRNDDLMISTLLPSLGIVRERCNQLLTRAMLEVQEGKFPEARADILAAHRFGRFMTQGFTVIEYIVGLAIDHTASDATVAYVSAPGLPRQELDKFRTEWEALPAFPMVGRYLDTERFNTLDFLAFASKHPGEVPGYLKSMMGDPHQESLEDWGWWLALQLRPAHFNAALRDVNEMMDRLVAASRAPTALEREDQVKEASHAIEAYCRGHLGLLSDPARRLVANLLPSLGTVVVLADVREMSAGLAHVAMALAAYKADQGRYPETLAELALKYIATVPTDIFTGGPLTYRKSGEGYLLYSVGANRKDDGGVASKGGIDNGDLVVQVK